jgi:hypothetical protein
MARNTTVLRGDAHEVSGLAVTYDVIPGMLVEPVATGWQPHTTAGGTAVAAFVRAQYENSQVDAGGMEDTIPSGDTITVVFPNKGAFVNALTDDTIVRGEFVQSAGDGKVALFDSGVIVGQAMADSDLSGTNGRVTIAVL